MRVHVGIPNEQIRRDLHQRVSELFLCKYAGYSEHPDWQSSEHEQDEDPVILRDEETIPRKGLADGEWNHHLLLEEPSGSMLTATVHIFSDSVFCTGASDLSCRVRAFCTAR